MWYEKYRPEESLKTYFGNRNNVRISVNWMNSVIKGNPIDEGLFYFGPPGTGKTSLTQVLSDVFKASFIRTNASDNRKKEDIKEIIAKGSSRGLTSKVSFVVLDEGESLKTADLHKIIDHTHPILIVNDKYEVDKGIRNRLINLEFDYPSVKEKMNYIEFILEGENRKLEGKKKKIIAENSRTFRSVAKNLQMVCVSGSIDFIETKTDYDKFEEVSRVLQGKDVGRANINPRELLTWALDNGGNPALISKLDRLLGETLPNDYRSWKYVYDLIKCVGASGDVDYPRTYRLMSKYSNGDK